MKAAAQHLAPGRPGLDHSDLTGRDERFTRTLARLRPYGQNSDLADTLAELDARRLRHETEHGDHPPGIRNDLLQALLQAQPLLTPATVRWLLTLAARPEPIVVRTALEALRGSTGSQRLKIKAALQAHLTALPLPRWAHAD